VPKIPNNEGIIEPSASSSSSSSSTFVAVGVKEKEVWGAGAWDAAKTNVCPLVQTVMSMMRRRLTNCAGVLDIKQGQ
jgi:hypothetical protein